MEAYVTEELVWALHRQRTEDARKIWLAGQARQESEASDRPNRSGPANYLPMDLRPAGNS